MRARIEKRLEEKRRELIALTSQFQALENQRQALLQQILQLQGLVQGLEELLEEEKNDNKQKA